ncbi:molybdate ABC transporter permease subunit [Salinithrix halophila]|uniref:Molybdenum transport system permease n=1 Tax=Salinithrix halophila TaxID=1485204 RepID=A0ABV8JKU7_9BACL
MTYEEFWSPVLLSLRVALTAGAFAFSVAAVTAWWMAGRRFRGKTLLETLMMLPLVLPPTVIGFLLLLVLGRESVTGRMLETIFSQSPVFTWWAAVIAAGVVSFPLIYQTVKTGLEGVEGELEEAARTMGAGEWQVFRFVTLPLAWRSLVTAAILGLARGLGEFGATLMVAGNIPGRTQTVPTAIYLAVDAGNWVLAAAWAGTIISISFLLLALGGRLARGN